MVAMVAGKSAGRGGAQSDARAEGLFRREVTEALKPKAYGEVVLDPGAASGRLAWVAILLLVGLALWLATGSLTRRTTVSGQLQPEGGMRRIVASHAGVVLSAPVAEGQQVRQGEVLFVLSGERPQAGGSGGVQSDALRQIERRRASIEAEQRRLDADAAMLAELARRQRQAWRDDRDRLDRQIALQAGQVAAAREALARYQGLLDQGFMSRDEVLPRQAELAEARGRLEALGRDRAGLTRALVAADREADEATSRLAARRDELLRADSLLAQDLAEARLRREWVLTAPVDGRLTLAKAAPGQSVEQGQTLAQLLPEGAALQAQLLAPSRAAGFVKAGTQVRLRYDAYPYQKFGQHAGVVVSVAAAPLEQGAGLAAQAAGVAEAQAGTEPLFPVTVQLPAQSMQALGKEWPLRAGMRVQAELLHETRRLYEWVFEPLQAWRVRLADPRPAPSGEPPP